MVAEIESNRSAADGRIRGAASTAVVPARKGRGNGAGRGRVRTAVLILGMHRSGTSALARVFNLLGCDLPRTLLGGDGSNEAGHWESVRVAELNDRLLASGGSSWDDWLEFNPRWLNSPKAEEFREEALQLLEEEFGKSRLYVLKDPRMCRIPRFWAECLRDFGARTVVVLPLRNPLEVAASLETRNRFEPAFGQLMWLRHVLDAEIGSRGMTRFFTSYDDLLNAWSDVADRAEAALGLSWPRASDAAAAEIGDFLRDGLRHHSQARSRVAKNARLSHWLRKSFEILSRWAEEGENEEDHAALDAIRDELNRAAPAFSQLITAGRKAAATAHELCETLGRSRTERAEIEKTLEQTQARLDATVAESDRHAEEAEQLRESRMDLESKLNDMQQWLESATAEAERHTEEAQELRESRDTLQARLDETVADAAAKAAELQSRLAQTESALEQRRHEAEQTAAQLEASQEEARQLAEARRRDAEEHQAAQIAAARSEAEMQARVEEQAREIERMHCELGAAAERSARLRTTVSAELARAVAGLRTGSRWRFLRERRIRRQANQLRSTGLVDAEWYLAGNIDVAESGYDPVTHYLLFGAEEGREPNPRFVEAAEGSPSSDGADAESDSER